MEGYCLGGSFADLTKGFVQRGGGFATNEDSLAVFELKTKASVAVHAEHALPKVDPPTAQLCGQRRVYDFVGFYFFPVYFLLLNIQFTFS